MDLWVNPTREAAEQLAANLAPDYAGQVAELRERAMVADRTSRLRPEDDTLRQRAEQAMRAYLQARDSARRITWAELAYDAAGRGETIDGMSGPRPRDNEELFPEDSADGVD
jgi:hypothetical protein